MTNTVDNIQVAEEVKVEERFRTDVDVSAVSNEDIIESMTEVASGKIGLLALPSFFKDMSGGQVGFHIANDNEDDFELAQMSNEDAVEFAKAILKLAAPEMEITESGVLEDLHDDAAKLSALESAGVDNWSGYDYAMELMSNE